MSVAPAGAFDSLRGPWHHDDDRADDRDADDHEEESSDDHEEESCVAPSAPATTATTTAPVSGASVSQTVTVVVPPIVRVLAASDNTVTVRTNAARPPAPGDQVWVRQADDSYVPADAAMAQRVLSATWSDASWCSTTAKHTSVG